MKNLNIDVDRNAIINVFIIIISFLATLFIPYIINFEGALSFSNSVISLALFIAFVILLKQTFTEENLPKIKSVGFLSFLFSTFLVIGNNIETHKSVNYKDLSIYLAIFFISIIIDAILVQFYKIVEKIETKKMNRKKLISKDLKGT